MASWSLQDDFVGELHVIHDPVHRYQRVAVEVSRSIEPRKSPETKLSVLSAEVRTFWLTMTASVVSQNTRPRISHYAHRSLPNWNHMAEITATYQRMLISKVQSPTRRDTGLPGRNARRLRALTQMKIGIVMLQTTMQ